MSRKKIEISGVGSVLLERSRRARHINLSVQPFKGARVAVPTGVSFEQAEAVVRSKKGWLQKHLSRAETLEQEAETLALMHPLPKNGARRLLVGRLRELAEQHGFTYNRIFVKNQRTRWGSCSTRNNINLNINLARLPARLIDYTLLHELVHTRIRNHGPLFWRELKRLLPDAELLDRELDRYSGLLR